MHDHLVWDACRSKVCHMTPEQILYARTMFQNRVLMASAQRYEDLFVAVMTKRIPGFRPIKPHGNRGDEANDGYIRRDGKFYQVYARSHQTTR